MQFSRRYAAVFLHTGTTCSFSSLGMQYQPFSLAFGDNLYSVRRRHFVSLSFSLGLLYGARS